MNIAIIGAGNVGKTLGSGWSRAGHSVTFGVRNLPEKADESFTLKSVEEAIQSSEVVVLAVPHSAVEELASEFGDFGGRTVMDCTNPINAEFSGLLPSETSAAEELASQSTSGRVVKCFNTVGANIMANPKFETHAATMLYCGDDQNAKLVVHQLAADLGFDPVDAGPLHQAGWLEGMAWLWISMAMKFGHGRDMAFILHKQRSE